MKPSQVIAERLATLGYPIATLPLSEPRREYAWNCSGWRSAGCCCWSAKVHRADEMWQDLLCWHTMQEVARAPVERWSITWNKRNQQYELDLTK